MRLDGRQRHWLIIEPLPGDAPELNPAELHVNALSSVQATFSPYRHHSTRHSTARRCTRHTLEPDPAALPSTRNRPRTEVQGCVLKALCGGDTREPPSIAVDYRRAFPQFKAGVVGLGGLEPPASSLSEIDGRALCYPGFPLVVRLRKSYKDG
jgi:hypothetical protein